MEDVQFSSLEDAVNYFKKLGTVKSISDLNLRILLNIAPIIQDNLYVFYAQVDEISKITSYNELFEFTNGTVGNASTMLLKKMYESTQPPTLEQFVTALERTYKFIHSPANQYTHKETTSYVKCFGMLVKSKVKIDMTKLAEEIAPVASKNIFLNRYDHSEDVAILTLEDDITKEQLRNYIIEQPQYNLFFVFAFPRSTIPNLTKFVSIPPYIEVDGKNFFTDASMNYTVVRSEKARDYILELNTGEQVLKTDKYAEYIEVCNLLKKPFFVVNYDNDFKGVSLSVQNIFSVVANTLASRKKIVTSKLLTEEDYIKQISIVRASVPNNSYINNRHGSFIVQFVTTEYHLNIYQNALKANRINHQMIVEDVFPQVVKKFTHNLGGIIFRFYGDFLNQFTSAGLAQLELELSKR